MSGSGNSGGNAALRSGLARLAAAAILLAAGMAQAAIFDDGNDRKLLYDLREKPAASLTDEERMILRAADRYGNVGFCSESGGNATLIDYFGRPAIVTSAHLFYDYKTGKSWCTDGELRSASFMPNVSYLDARGSHPKTFTHRQVKLVMPEANAGWQRKNLGAGFRPEDDFVIFYLEEDIRDDVMPGGHRRGAMTLSVGKGSAIGTGQLTMIGVAPDNSNGQATLYQTCRYKGLKFVGLSHDCDTVKGSSGSVLLVKSGDDGFILRGVHAGSIHGNDVIAATDDTLEWNYGSDFTGNRHFDDLLAHAGRPSAAPSLSPALIPYQIQFLLHRAGCYSGKLDNQWGPGSRKALDAFVSRTGAKLPGREPTLELWDALEAAVKKPKAACR